ncbi:hypothetical protein ACTXT7_000018 [Hymenolepis weldensis]
MIGEYVLADPTEVPTVMHGHKVSSNSDGLRVNTDADAYVETLQTIVVKPLWVDGVVNGRPFVFQQDSVLSHKALKTHDWMDDRECSSACQIELLAAAS